MFTLPILARIAFKPTHSCAPRWLRYTALLMSFIFSWTALLAAPLQALAQTSRPSFAAPKPLPVPVPYDDPAWHTINYHKAERKNAALRHSKPTMSHRLPPESLTLLDEAGHLAGSVSASEVAAWKQQIHQPRYMKPLAMAKLHVHIGAYELAHDEQPQQAIWHFHQAQQLSPRKSSLAWPGRL